MEKGNTIKRNKKGKSSYRDESSLPHYLDKNKSSFCPDSLPKTMTMDSSLHQHPEEESDHYTVLSLKNEENRNLWQSAGFDVSSRGCLFRCQHCSYATVRKTNMKRHVQANHFVREARCDCCCLVFRTRAEFVDHMVAKHRSGFFCPLCNHCSSRQALFRRHYKKHTGIKDYVCGLCTYATNNKSNLERHCLNVHSLQTIPLASRRKTRRKKKPEVKSDVEEEETRWTRSAPVVVPTSSSPQSRMAEAIESTEKVTPSTSFLPTQKKEPKRTNQRAKKSKSKIDKTKTSSKVVSVKRETKQKKKNNKIAKNTQVPKSSAVPLNNPTDQNIKTLPVKTETAEVTSTEVPPSVNSTPDLETTSPPSELLLPKVTGTLTNSDHNNNNREEGQDPYRVGLLPGGVSIPSFDSFRLRSSTSAICRSPLPEDHHHLGGSSLLLPISSTLEDYISAPSSSLLDLQRIKATPLESSPHLTPPFVSSPDHYPPSTSIDCDSNFDLSVIGGARDTTVAPYIDGNDISGNRIVPDDIRLVRNVEEGSFSHPDPSSLREHFEGQDTIAEDYENHKNLKSVIVFNPNQSEVSDLDSMSGELKNGRVEQQQQEGSYFPTESTSSIQTSNLNDYYRTFTPLGNQSGSSSSSPSQTDPTVDYSVAAGHISHHFHVHRSNHTDGDTQSSIYVILDDADNPIFVSSDYTEIGAVYHLLEETL